MADTNTANIALLIADLTDGFNMASHIEANFSTIDGLMGLVKCTSSTRPSNTYGGQGIFETDTLRVAVNTNTKASPSWTYVSHAALAGTLAGRPTTGRSTGELYYETDTTRLVVWNGSSWEQKAFGQFACTAATHPASPFQGLEIFETDTGLSAVYSGSAYIYGVSQAAPTQALIATTASVTFTGLLAVSHMVILWQARTTSANTSDSLLLQLNSDTGSNYGSQDVYGTSTTVAAVQTNVAAGTSIAIGACAGGGASAGYYGGGQISIPGWGKAASGHQATVVGIGIVAAGNSTGSEIVGVYGGVYNPSAALTGITLKPSAGSFAAGTSISVYVYE